MGKIKIILKKTILGDQIVLRGRMGGVGAAKKSKKTGRKA